MQRNRSAIDKVKVEIKKNFLFIGDVGIWHALLIGGKFALVWDEFTKMFFWHSSRRWQGNKPNDLGSLYLFHYAPSLVSFPERFPTSCNCLLFSVCLSYTSFHANTPSLGTSSSIKLSPVIFPCESFQILHNFHYLTSKIFCGAHPEVQI